MSKRIRSFALPIIGSLIAGPWGAAAGASVDNYTQTHNLGSALKSGALSGAGSFIGGNIGSSLGGAAPTVIGGLESALGPDIGSFIGQNLGSTALTSIPSLAGSFIGSNLASGLAGGLSGSAKNVSPQGETAAAAFKPQQEAAMPASPNFAGMSPLQQSTNIATGGVYGGGQGPSEQQYFLNLINRRLVDENGNVDQNLNDIKPVESSYLDQLGLGGYGNANDLLEAISKRKQAA